MQTVFTIKTKDGIGRAIADLAALLYRWSGEKAIRIQVVEQKEKRSLQQNNLYWAWIDQIARHVGDDKESVHYDLRCLFLPFSTSRITKKPVPSSTTKLTVKNMAEYMEQVQAWALQYLNLTLPSAEDLIDYSAYER